VEGLFLAHEMSSHTIPDEQAAICHHNNVQLVCEKERACACVRAAITIVTCADLSRCDGRDGDRTGAEGGSSVEAEPSHPQKGGTEGGHGQVGRRELAVVLVCTRQSPLKYEKTTKLAPGTCRVPC
jgi:hypothetical protein